MDGRRGFDSGYEGCRLFWKEVLRQGNSLALTAGSEEVVDLDAQRHLAALEVVHLVLHVVQESLQ